jgi:hypothetical protein
VMPFESFSCVKLSSWYNLAPDAVYK